MWSFTPYLKLLGDKMFEVRWMRQEIGWTLGLKPVVTYIAGTSHEDTLLTPWRGIGFLSGKMDVRAPSSRRYPLGGFG